MSIEFWLAKSNLFELIAALRDDCKLLKASLTGEDFEFEFNPSHPKWQNLVAKLKVPGATRDLFDAKDLFQSRLGLIRWYQLGLANRENSDVSEFAESLECFVGSVNDAWTYKRIHGKRDYPHGEPAWIRSMEAKSPEIAAVIRDVGNQRYHWSHPGVLMACDLLMKLMRIDRKPELEVRTKVIFAFEHRQTPEGILANLTIERLPNGSGLLIPHAAHSGLLWMPFNQGDSFSTGLQNAWLAAREYLESKQNDWKVPHEDSGRLLSYDWRWRLDLSGLHETLPRLGWQNPIIPIKGRSAETAIACALIAAAKHNPDSAGAGDAKDMDPLDPNITCTATIDLSRDDLPLGIVTDIKTKTLLGKDILAKERIYDVIVSDLQPAATIPDNQEDFKTVPVHTLGEAYEQMVIYPRITRGVNRAIAAQTKKDLDTYCTPYITPDIADVNRWQQAASEDPAKYTIYPPENAVLNEETLLELMAARLKYEPNLIRSNGSQPAREESSVTLQGNRIFIEGESGLGKSMFLLRCQHEISSTYDSLRLPIRFGKTNSNLNDSSLSQVDWSGLTIKKLLSLNQVSVHVETFNRSLTERNRAVVPNHTLLSWMDWLMRRGRIVLLLDALDQTHSHGVQQLGPKIAEEGWRQCPVIMTGRRESKYDRRLARSDNHWHNLRLVPFDRRRWIEYLGEMKKNSVFDEAILSVPLFLHLTKTHFSAYSYPSKPGKISEPLTKTKILDEAIKEMIRTGFANIKEFKPELRNCFDSDEALYNCISELAWYMYSANQFLNYLDGEPFKNLENLVGKDRLEALDSFQLISSYSPEGDERSRIVFRHPTYFDYFLALFLTRRPITSQDGSIFKNQNQNRKGCIRDNLSDKEWLEYLLRIHDWQESIDRFPGLNAWSNTLRFLLTKSQISNGLPPFESIDQSIRSSDWVALRLIEFGNPWLVLEVDKAERGAVGITKSILDLCRKLCERFWFIGFDGASTEQIGNVELASVKKLLLSEIDVSLMVDRRFRDAGYLTTLRDLVDSKYFHVAYNKDVELVESIRRLPSKDGESWDFLASFKAINIESLNPSNGSSLWVADFPVTNSLFELFCPSHRRYRNELSSHHDDPVIYVSWWMAVEFMDWLSCITGKSFCLPTDSEWNIVALGSGNGTSLPESKFNMDANIWSESRRNREGTRSRSQSIKTFQRPDTTAFPNILDRPSVPMDLFGNVWEWMSNCDTGEPPPLDPRDGHYRLLKGGCWVSKDEFCTVGKYEISHPAICNQFYGFRAFYRESGT